MSKEEEQPSVGSIEDLLENGEIIEIPKDLPDFTDDLESLADAIVKNWATQDALCLGELHGFYLIYDGVSLGLTHPEIDEEQMRQLHAVFEDFVEKTARESFDDNFPDFSKASSAVDNFLAALAGVRVTDGGYPVLPIFPIGEYDKLRARVYESESPDITWIWILNVSLHHYPSMPKDRSLYWLNNVAKILKEYREGTPSEVPE